LISLSCCVRAWAISHIVWQFYSHRCNAYVQMRMYLIFLPFCHRSRVWQTDGWTDRILIARLCLHTMQRGKKWKHCLDRKVCSTAASVRSMHYSSAWTGSWRPVPLTTRCLVRLGRFYIPLRSLVENPHGPTNWSKTSSIYLDSWHVEIDRTSWKPAILPKSLWAGRRPARTCCMAGWTPGFLTRFSIRSSTG